MLDAGVLDKVKSVLERHAEDERMLDAYWQWASNPTPPSAGYALEENCGFIATNLLTRYGQPGIEVVTKLADEAYTLRQEASVFDLRQAIFSVLNGETGTLLRKGIANRLNVDSPKRRVLAAWLVQRARWRSFLGAETWVAGEFDWALGVDLEQAAQGLKTPLALALSGGEVLDDVALMREALAVGVVNRLFYRSLAGRMEPKVRPGPRIQLSVIVYA
jgi:hypothetical protein